jgi:transcriptional regulator with GAF, ATPase, and Fis domain
VNSQALAHTLSEIAETASETLELQAVFDRVATSIRELIPFDNMGVVRIVDGQWAVRHAATVGCEQPDTPCSDSEPILLTAWSPRLRPRPGAVTRIDDAKTELDPAFLIDATLLEGGVLSALWGPFGSAGTFTGGVWLSASRSHAFTIEHEAVLSPIAALLGSAVEHWRIWDGERRRRERLDRLEALLGTLAESLDVRDVFPRISETVRPILDHDVLLLTEVDDKAQRIRIVAAAGPPDMPEIPESVPLTARELERRALPYEIVADLPALPVVTERDRLLSASGLRSLLRVPLSQSGEVHGSIGFLHREPARYGSTDVEVARRLADRIALTLSHQRLAEEARHAAEARERAERLEATVATLTRALEERERGRIVGVSRPWRDVLAQIGRVASSDTTVLITGESGTGKEVISRLIHHGSPRAAKPFMAINCAALPEQLLESELFGHEKGAFTGAISSSIGRLEQAAGGTLFLDEIAEMSPVVQAKLLRVLQEREFQRVGGTRTLRADVRVIAATNRDLAAAIAAGQFREDLYYRLDVFRIHVPPLRERTEDILPLAESFLEDLGRTMGRPAAGISRDAREWLLAHSWPGNARELRNAIERAILLCDGGLITRDHLPAATSRSEAARPPKVTGPLGVVAAFPADSLDVATLDRSLVERALEQARGNKSKAARLLGLTRSQLYSRLEKYRLLG